jgi:hypothetical protein
MKTNTAPTSLEAYALCIAGLSKQGKELLNLLSVHPDVTANGLALHIEGNFPPHHRHNVQARLADLRTEGLVYTNGKRPCTITGITAQTWRVTPSEKFQEFQKTSLEQSLKNAQATVKKLELKLAAVAGA